jgi:ribA/ribD-fused uncharacterized protein
MNKDKGCLVVRSADDKEDLCLFFGYRSPLSNFFYNFFTLDGKTWNCGEQYYQFMKAVQFGDVKSQEAIRATNVQRDQKRLGRDVLGFNAPEWEGVCCDIMRRLLRAKFSQSNFMRTQLLATGKTTLVEASPYDKRWGNGLWATDPAALDRASWKGENWLGLCLMEIRNELSG